MRIWKKALVSLVVFTAPTVDLHAGVAIGNGDFYIGFTDMEHEAPLNTFQLKLQRTYNSKSQYDGIFGYGWASDLETFLIPSSDGSIVIQENGGGDKTRFSPKEFSREDLEKQVDKLMQAYVAKEKLGISAQKEKRAKLLSDANERDELSRNLGLVLDLPVGTKLYSTQRGSKQVVAVFKGGYVREYSDGKQEIYSAKVDVVDQSVDATKKRVLKGVLRITRLIDPLHKAQVFYEYDKQGRLSSLSDKKTQTIRFRYKDNGKVAEATDSSGNKAVYEYCESPSYNAAKGCGMGDLVKSKDTSGAVYSYQYDSIHNITKVGYPDHKFDEMTYWPVNSEHQGGVRSVKSKEGTLTEYKYWQNPKDKEGNYKVELKTTEADGKKSETNYEYFEKKRADGSNYRYKLITVLDGEKTETIYNECCGQPLQITSSEGITKFEYYPGTGLPKEKNTSTEIVQWEYHPKLLGKITKISISDKVTKEVKRTEFRYDESNGQLVKAQTSSGKGIALYYDNQGRIAQMLDQEKRKILFKYTNLTKPAEIVQDGVGSIQVTYDKAGNIKDVQSKGGRQIAASVAAAFQNLLEIIKPAGIQPI